MYDIYVLVLSMVNIDIYIRTYIKMYYLYGAIQAHPMIISWPRPVCVQYTLYDNILYNSIASTTAVYSLTRVHAL